MAGEVARAKWARERGTVHWSEAIAEAIVARTAAGESLRAICRDEGTPTVPSVCRWARERPAFHAALDAARAAAGRPFRPAGVTTYCEETAEAIFDRLCAGEGLVAICRDPDMPAISTAKRWVKVNARFGEAVAMARDICADILFERGMAWAEAVTPATAQAAKVQLAHLRWSAGKLAPRKYGPHKAGEAGSVADRQRVLHVYTKKYVSGGGPDGLGCWSEEPAEHVYSMVSTDSPVGAGERLPPPDVVREPAAAQPGGDRLGRGGAVEAEYEDETGEDWGSW